MSLFQTDSARCPSCEGTIRFETVYSVNADRRPDLRQSILDETFQMGTCPQCGATLRMQPNLTYFDQGRNQWFLVEPASGLETWTELERAARTVFDTSYGPKASAAAREIGETLVCRITFGWPGLREKIVCQAAGLDDVTLECTKILILRGVGEAPIADDADLRLQWVNDDTLSFVWLRSRDETELETFTVPRALYDQVASDPNAWTGIRQRLENCIYVDMNRLLVEPNVASA
jgi:hypothetical protein